MWDLLNIQDMTEKVQMTTILNKSATHSHTGEQKNLQKEGGRKGENKRDCLAWTCEQNPPFTLQSPIKDHVTSIP